MGAVNYRNTKPLLYGFEQGAMQDQMELITDYPAKIAQALLNEEIDIGLVPVAILNLMPEWHIVGGYGIGCDGPVASVCIFSEVPLEEVETLLLDYQSRTSVQLARVLLQDHWKLTPVLQPANEQFIDQIKSTTAAVVIGDRALELRSKIPYVYDLGEAWKAYTGLPFLFAAWVSRRPMDAAFEQAFDAANQMGLNHLDTVLEANPYVPFDLKQYYTQFIQFEVDAAKRSALELFLNKIKQL